MNRYRIDQKHLTVIVTDENGEDFDLNAEGEPCSDIFELQGFIRELHTNEAFSAKTRDRLLVECIFEAS